MQFRLSDLPRPLFVRPSLRRLPTLPSLPQLVLISMLAAFLLYLSGTHPTAVEAATHYCAGQRATIVGTWGDDDIYGTTGRDVIVGLGGKDTIFGNDGNDLICGDGGNDTIYAGSGADTVDSGPADDTVYGGNGSDVLLGGDGSDYILGGDDSDVIRGGGGNDRIYGGPGNDRLHGNDGDDFIKGGPSGDLLYGASGNDELYGALGPDRLYGSEGADYLSGGGHDDFLNGGPGADSLAGGGGRNTIDWFRLGIDTMAALSTSDTVNMNWLTTTLSGSSDDLAVAVPIYGWVALKQVRTVLRPQLRPDDIFVLTAGRGVEWVNSAAAALRHEFPANKIMLVTDGISHIREAAAGVDPRLVDNVVYTYEPGFPTIPEFDWDFAKTLSNFEDVDRTLRNAGLSSGGHVTGRAVLQRREWDWGWGSYGWYFGAIDNRVDDLFVQTQGYCKDSVEKFTAAIDKLDDQVSGTWYPQITIVEHKFNGVPLWRAKACTDQVRGRNMEGVLVRWSPDEVDVLRQYLAYLGR